MSRIIEFRAFDAYQNKMYSWADLGKAESAGRLSLWNSLIGSVDHIKVMQFVGLHDKNGNKIFEGDIVHLQWIHNYTGSIEFRHGSFCMVSADKEIIVRALGELYSENINVIGNIHQTPNYWRKKQ